MADFFLGIDYGTGGVVTAVNEIGLLSRTDANGSTTTYAYDAVGNLATRTDRNGRLTTFVHDDLDRLVTIRQEFSYDRKLLPDDHKLLCLHFVHPQFNRRTIVTSDGICPMSFVIILAGKQRCG